MLLLPTIRAALPGGNPQRRDLGALLLLPGRPTHRNPARFGTGCPPHAWSALAARTCDFAALNLAGARARWSPASTGWPWPTALMSGSSRGTATTPARPWSGSQRHGTRIGKPCRDACLWIPYPGPLHKGPGCPRRKWPCCSWRRTPEAVHRIPWASTPKTIVCRSRISSRRYMEIGPRPSPGMKAARLWRLCVPSTVPPPRECLCSHPWRMMAE